jgi:AGCS family alanine or glycine:cation symporter
MAIPNLVSLIMLSGVVARDTQHYLWDGNLDEEN